jgi:enediyne biosynthesis protein E8
MSSRPSRRQLVAALTGALVAVGSGVVSAPSVAAAPTALAPYADGPGLGTELGPLDTVATLEAFADTMVPGEKRHRLDRAIAGAAPGPGAVQAGAVALLQLPELGVELLLPELAALLNTEATAWALARGRVLLPTQPPFVALDFSDRTRLAGTLLSSAGPDQKVFVLLALFSAAAFDTAAQLHTAEALERRHPGLTWLRFPEPDADGFWRYPTYSYGKRLAQEHPHTTAGGHPA